MKWEHTKLRGNNQIVFLKDRKGTEWRDVGAGIASCLLKFCAEVPSAMDPETWDRIICEVWLDSGRIIFLASKKGATGKPPYIVQFLSSFLEKQFEAIGGEEDNPNFTRDLLDMRHKVFQAFMDATDDPDVNLALQELRKLNDCRLFFQFASDEDTRQELFVVWQKPKVKRARKPS
jgi:hypothetical protein